jgi:uncharacterized protein YehS (DUF1456 family)
MTNNDILRRVRYIFDLSDSKMITIFGLADSKVTREQVSDWLKKDDDPAYKSCSDVNMATFLNGLINLKRGKREGEQPAPETRLTNNIIFKKLTIAFNIRSEEILAIILAAGFVMSKHELSSFFRKPDNKHYRVCKDQILRNFLQGLQYKLRDQLEVESAGEVKPVVATLTAPELEPEPVLEPAPELKPDPIAVSVPESKPEPKPEPKPESKSNKKTASKTKWKKSASSWAKD